jgi:hypothetical protein
MAKLGATVEDGPKANPANGVQEWRITTSDGKLVIFGVTEVALKDEVDIGALLTDDAFAETISGLEGSTLMYVSSDLKIRQWPIEDVAGD